MSKYVIIDAEAIQKRVEELKQKRELAGNLFEDIEYDHNQISTEIRIYEQLLSQSTPLIPEIEKAWEDGRNGTKILANFPFVYNKYVNKTSKDYISNLNLDI